MSYKPIPAALVCAPFEEAIEVKLIMKDKKKIRIRTNSRKYITSMIDSFTKHVSGYYHMPLYRSGQWNGKTCMINGTNHSFPYGLLIDYIRFHKAIWPEVKLEISEDVKKIFRGFPLEIKYDLKLQPRPYQKESIESCLKYAKGIIRSATACHTKGDKIILSTGETKNIENIKIGDYVIGKDGNPKKVLRIFNGIDDLYKIKPKNKRTSITVTNNHILHLGFTKEGGRRDKSNKFVNISVNDYRYKNKYYKHIAKLAYSNKEIKFEYQEIDCKLSPYFIGLYLGDGSKNSCSITNIDRECIDEIYKEANKFNMEVIKKEKYGYFLKGASNNNIIDIHKRGTHNRNIIFKEFDKLGIIFGRKNKCNCEDRFIPKIIFNQSIEYRKEVLAGLIDSDGSLTNKTYYEYTSKSKRLRDDIELLSISLGLVCSKTERRIFQFNNDGIIYYRLIIMGDISKIPVRIERKKIIKQSNTNAYICAFDVEYVGKGEFYGIQVEDSLYLTDNGMITHNSGKSAVISYVIKNLLDNKLAKKALIVVPSLSLIEQFHSDMIDYGIKYSIGKVYADSHEWDGDIVISTWQSLSKNHKMLKNYDIVIVDETHLCKSRELKKIMSLSTAHYKFGFTGTLHSNELDNWNTKAYIGPILKDYPSGLLADQGFISKCNVKAILMDYLHPPKGTYLEIKDIIFRNQFRLKFIANLVESLDHNVLLLVGLLDEGHMLKKCLEKYTKKEVVFLSGKDNIETREDWRQQMMQGKTNIALIATYGIMAQGVNIPNLKYMIMASPFKAKIRVLQSIGRTLRLHENKQEGSFIFDICDQVRFLKKHGEIRHKFYQTEKFNIEVQEVNEG